MQSGLEPLDSYLAGLGLNQGWLVIFDRRSGIDSIAERTTVEKATTANSRKVTVIRG